MSKQSADLLRRELWFMIKTVGNLKKNPGTFCFITLGWFLPLWLVIVWFEKSPGRCLKRQTETTQYFFCLVSDRDEICEPSTPRRVTKNSPELPLCPDVLAHQRLLCCPADTHRLMFLTFLTVRNQGFRLKWLMTFTWDLMMDPETKWNSATYTCVSF